MRIESDQLTELITLLKRTPMDDDLLSVQVVASKLEVTENTVWVYVRDGLLPKPVKILSPNNKRGATRWRKSAINQFIQSLPSA